MDAVRRDERQRNLVENSLSLEAGGHEEGVINNGSLP
jgi:hypothetical protein